MKKLIALLSLFFFLSVPAFATPTSIPIQANPSLNTSGGITAGSATLTFTAADTTNGNSFPLATSQNVLLIVTNTAGAPGTVTITSVADRKGRTGDIATYSIAANSTAAFGPFPFDGWLQADNTLHFTASATTIKYCPLQLF